MASWVVQNESCAQTTSNIAVDQVKKKKGREIDLTVDSARTTVRHLQCVIDNREGVRIFL